jgi:hypothetical protein
MTARKSTLRPNQQLAPGSVTTVAWATEVSILRMLICPIPRIQLRRTGAKTLARKQVKLYSRASLSSANRVPFYG